MASTHHDVNNKFFISSFSVQGSETASETQTGSTEQRVALSTSSSSSSISQQVANQQVQQASTGSSSYQSTM